MRRTVISLSLFALSLFVAAPASAATFIGTLGNLKAQVDFNLVGGNLIVTLANTATVAPNDPADILTGVFFTAGDPTLAKVSALLTDGTDSVVNDPDGQPVGGVVGGEWAYKEGLGGAPLGAAQGISSSGLGLFGPTDNFPGSDLESPAEVDGVQYGIATNSYVAGGGNGGINTSGLIKNSVTFNLGPYSGPFTFTKVSFQYGTGLSEPNINTTNITTDNIVTTAVPEPATLALLGSGLLFAVRGLRRRNKNDSTVA